MKFYKLTFILPLIVLFVGLFSCEKRAQPWASDLDFPPSFFKIGHDSSLSLQYSFEDQRDTISVKGDVMFTSKSDADWISVPRSNKRHSDLILHLQENKSLNAREGSVLLTSNDTLPAITIQVSQGGRAPFLETSKDKVTLNGTSFTIDAESNMKGYNIEVPQWITVSDSVFVNNFTKRFIFNVAASYFDNRTGKVEFIGKGDNEDIKDTVFISQLKTVFPDPGADLPVASLFDVFFTPDNVKDQSPFNFDITTGTMPDKPVLSFDNDLNMYVASFDASKQTHYKLDYAGNGTFTGGFSNHFTLEVYFKPDLINTGVATVVGSLLLGGMTIQYGKDDTLVMKLGSNDKGYYDYFTIGSNTVLQAGEYYDMVYAVDYGAGKVKVYENGTFKGEVDIDNSGYRIPYYGSDQWFGIGCDETTGNGENFFTGDIASVRFYSDVKTASDVETMYNQTQDRKVSTKISDLKDTIVNVLPQKLANASPDQKKLIQDAINIGWKLMNNIGASDNMIQTYLDNVNVLLKDLK